MPGPNPPVERLLYTRRDWWEEIGERAQPVPVSLHDVVAVEGRSARRSACLKWVDYARDRTEVDWHSLVLPGHPLADLSQRRGFDCRL